MGKSHVQRSIVTDCCLISDEELSEPFKADVPFTTGLTGDSGPF